MQESDIIAITGLNPRLAGSYRHQCGADKKGWSIAAVRKLEGFLGLPEGSIAAVDGEDLEELVICRIYQNPSILGVRREGEDELMRCRVPAHKRYRIGMKIKARHRSADLWDYRGVVKGQ